VHLAPSSTHTDSRTWGLRPSFTIISTKAVGPSERCSSLGATWPQAPIYTSLYRRESTFPGIGDRDVPTSFLDRMPVDAGFRGLFPLYPVASRSLGTMDADLVVSSSSGWAHAVRTSDCRSTPSTATPPTVVVWRELHGRLVRAASATRRSPGSCDLSERRGQLRLSASARQAGPAVPMRRRSYRRSAMPKRTDAVIDIAAG
jgi:hypothetical protein